MMIGTAESREARDPLTYRVIGAYFGVYRALGWGFLEVVYQRALVVEVKTVTQFESSHRAQLLNYLKATSIEKGLLLNFGPLPAFERLILTNDRKIPKPLRIAL
jgi:hypothetical protein